MATKGLTAKQKVFCTEYLKSFNATEAYLEAGYKCSRKSAGAAGHRLLKNVEIQAYLSKVREKVGNKTEITLARTLEEVSYVAYSRITDVLDFNDENVTLKSSKKLPDSVKAAIASVERRDSFTEGGLNSTRSLKMHNKTSACNGLASFLALTPTLTSAEQVLKNMD